MDLRIRESEIDFTHSPRFVYCLTGRPRKIPGRRPEDERHSRAALQLSEGVRPAFRRLVGVATADLFLGAEGVA